MINFLLFLSFLIFGIGILIILLRRTFLFILMGIEISMNAIAFSFFIFSRIQGNPAGEVVVFLLFGVAASGVAIGLALLFNLIRVKDTQDIEIFRNLKG